MVILIHAGYVKGHKLVEEWSPNNVVNFILACRRQGGIPMFMTHFAGMRFKYDSSNAVLSKCWGGSGEEISRYFYKVPEKDVETIEEGTGDWRKLMLEYAPEKMPEAEKYGIYIKGFKLPKIIVK